MIIENKFDYKELSRIEDNNERRYLTPQGSKVPSVTTIIGKTKDLTFLREWQKSVGKEKAEKIKVEASTLGTGMHKNIENYILDKPMSGSFMAQTLAKLIIDKGLANVNSIWGSEVSLYSLDLYAGTTDLVGLHQDQPAIIDFKNSLREKKLEWIDDYRAQIGAYALAHNEMFGTNIRKGVVMIATRDAIYQEFVFEGGEFDKCVTLWLNILEKYYKLQ